MRNFLHFFGIHHWGKWSEEMMGWRVSPLFGIKERITIQERVCLICNQKDLRPVSK